MATKKPKTAPEERLERQDFDLFDALSALDRKDYGWWDRLSEEQQRKFVPWMMTHWMSAIKSGGALGAYYVLSVDAAANKHMFNEVVQTHPKLQWLMLCASSPGRGKQFHQWIPHLSEKIGKLKTAATVKEVEEYWSKIYTSASKEDLRELADGYVREQNHRRRVAEMFPEMKLTDIETLAATITPEQIDQYEKDAGN